MRKLKLKNIIIFILLILALLLVYPTVVTIQIVGKDYDITNVVKIVKYGIKDKILDKNYSKTLDEALKSNVFIKNNIDKYLVIKYHNKKDFIKYVNSLIVKNYPTKDINLINEKLKDKEISLLIEEDKIQDISKYLEFDYFKSENLFRYIDYYYGSYKDAVVYVNIGLDKEFYTDSDVITKYSETVLANKYHKLDKEYIPDNLTMINDTYSKDDKQYLSKSAAKAFEEMCIAAKKEELYLLANSAYRSYTDQEEVYNTYLNLYGKSYVDNYVALPGFSEHQTGLALDVAAKGYNTFKTSPEYTWMLENSYKYGFILRYPKEKEEVTGYKNESWHFRYIGKKNASYVYKNKLTYEEYYVMFLDK